MARSVPLRWAGGPAFRLALPRAWLERSRGSCRPSGDPHQWLDRDHFRACDHRSRSMIKRESKVDKSLKAHSASLWAFYISAGFLSFRRITSKSALTCASKWCISTPVKTKLERARSRSFAQRLGMRLRRGSAGLVEDGSSGSRTSVDWLSVVSDETCCATRLARHWEHH